MPCEIEAKMRLSDPDSLRRHLRERGAQRLGAALEVNQYYDWPDARLREADCGLRIRRTRPLDSAGGDLSPSATVTYKGPRRPGELKIREEVEFAVDQGEMADALLLALGLVATVSFEKRRESWRLGPCQVELDELPHLGWFVEIEGPDEQAVQETRALLGMQKERLEPASYLALVQACRKERGMRETHFGF